MVEKTGWELPHETPLGAVPFEWDDARSDACFTHHGFDFACAVRAFLDDDRMVGRDRCRLLGAIEGRVFVVIYAMRGSAIRIADRGPGGRAVPARRPERRVAMGENLRS